jgi:DNA primase
MSHPASKSLPILSVAAALGLAVTGRRARCFNIAGHAGGQDDHPSLTFFEDSGRYKCFVCGVTGDAISLVRAVQGVSFHEATAWLLAQAGASAAPWRSTDRSVVPGSRVPDQAAVEVYSTMLKLSCRVERRSEGGIFLNNRGLNRKVARTHHIAEVDDPDEMWEALRLDYGEDRLRSAGLMSQQGRFLFARHRLLLFYFDDRRPVYLQARDLSGEANCKELSLAGLCSPVPFNSDVLKDAPAEVLVCEGVMDTLSALQLGYAAVGAPGVTGFRDEWFPRFRSVGRVTIVFDNDDAGRRQSIELRARFRWHRIHAEAVFPSRGKDLNDLLKSLHGEGK